MKHFRIIEIIFLLALILLLFVSCDASIEKNKDIFTVQMGHWLGGATITDTEGIHKNYTIKPYTHSGEKITMFDSGACEGNFTGTLTIDGDFLLNNYSFAKNDITKLVLGKKIDIDSQVFVYNDKLKEIVVDKNNPYLYVKNNCLIEKETDRLILATNDSVIPDGVKTISAGFYGLTEIKEIIVPDSVTCLSVAFVQDCPNLERLYIGKNVKEIRENPFAGCPKLTLEIDPENPYFRVEGNCIIKKDGNVLWTAFDKSVIPEGVESVRTGAFYYNDDIKEINFPDSVTIINAAVSECHGIKTIFIPKSVEILNACLISNCICEEISSEKAMDFTIYCEAEEKPEGWIDEWQIGATNVYWGVSREEYESIISQNS